jgi:hypothetical protein
MPGQKATRLATRNVSKNGKREKQEETVIFLPKIISVSHVKKIYFVTFDVNIRPQGR